MALLVYVAPLMLISIVSNKESRGLHLDSLLLKEFLEQLGHTVHLWQYDEPQSESVDLVLFCEVTVRQLVHLSKYPPWLLVNCEFFRDSDLPVVRSSFGKILCKTHEAHRICTELCGDMAVYVGFIAQDRYLPDVPREPRFLHVAGHSQVKGTHAVVDAWRWSHNGKKLTAPLTVVCDFLKQGDMPEHVTVLDGISDAELADLQNRCMFHLQPSMTEGFGHVLRESLSVYAFILTTSAPPMNEIRNALHIGATPSRTFNQSQFYDVSALDIHRMVAATMHPPLANPESRPIAVRREFEDGNEAFRVNFAELFDQFKPRVSIPWERSTSDALQIAFIGNFEAPESTENLIRDALTRGLGHEVENIQENLATLEQLKRATALNDIFLWVRTPGWLQVPDAGMFALLDSLKVRGIPTVSIHLDKFWGIPDREVLIGKIPFWKTQFVFTADGSKDPEFWGRGVNHHWMRPAMSEMHLHVGMRKDEYMCDVGFVGARGYHTEYPFRSELIRFLEQTYRDRFRLVEGVRGHALNDVYASMRVVIGDCFASGTPRYYSDRMVETPGRGGYLLSPKIEGLDIPVPTFKPQDLDSLHREIELLLRGDFKERQEVISDCMEHVRKYDTWTVRMGEILKTVMG